MDTGCLAGLEDRVDYDISFVGGFKNALFGGEGLFLATLTGPGTVFLQSLPFSRLADRIFAAAKFEQKGQQDGVAGIGGGFLGGLVGRRQKLNISEEKNANIWILSVFFSPPYSR